MKVKIKKISALAKTPKYQSAGAGCFDIFATKITFDHHGNAIINTGLAFEIPKGKAMVIYSRSGQGFNHDTRLANCVGVIDSDYRGEVLVKLTADSVVGQEYLDKVKQYQSVAQAMIVDAQQVDFVECDNLSDTDRGAGGFGSTGK